MKLTLLPRVVLSFQAEVLLMKSRDIPVKTLTEAVGRCRDITIFRDLRRLNPDSPFAEEMDLLKAGLNRLDIDAKKEDPRMVMSVFIIGNGLALFIGYGKWFWNDFAAVLGRTSFSCMGSFGDIEKLAEQLRTEYCLEITS